VDQIPVLKIGSVLLVSIQVDMHDQLALALQESLAKRVIEDRAVGVVIDISALDVVDTFIGRMIANMAAMAAILNARTVLVGMQPAVAITMVELGLRLKGVLTALNVERGMALLETRRQADDY
jgi:rsbT antagonist protein RsbS